MHRWFFVVFFSSFINLWASNNGENKENDTVNYNEEKKILNEMRKNYHDLKNLKEHDFEIFLKIKKTVETALVNDEKYQNLLEKIKNHKETINKEEKNNKNSFNFHEYNKEYVEKIKELYKEYNHDFDKKVRMEQKILKNCLIHQKLSHKTYQDILFGYTKCKEEPLN